MATREDRVHLTRLDCIEQPTSPLGASHLQMDSGAFAAILLPRSPREDIDVAISANRGVEVWRICARVG